MFALAGSAQLWRLWSQRGGDSSAAVGHRPTIRLWGCAFRICGGV